MLTSRQIKKLQKRDERMVSLVIDEYGPWVKEICYRIVSPVAGSIAADECVNDVFLRIWTKSEEFHGTPEQFRAWVGHIAKYRAIDAYRSYQRRLDRERPYEELPERIAEEQREETIHTYIQHLSEVDQRIFRMKYEEGYSNEKIAETLDLTIASVDNRLYRGRKKIATHMEGSHLHEQMG